MRTQGGQLVPAPNRRGVDTSAVACARRLMCRAWLARRRVGSSHSLPTTPPPWWDNGPFCLSPPFTMMNTETYHAPTPPHPHLPYPSSYTFPLPHTPPPHPPTPSPYPDPYPPLGGTGPHIYKCPNPYPHPHPTFILYIQWGSPPHTYQPMMGQFPVPLRFGLPPTHIYHHYIGPHTHTHPYLPFSTHTPIYHTPLYIDFYPLHVSYTHTHPTLHTPTLSPTTHLPLVPHTYPHPPNLHHYPTPHTTTTHYPHYRMPISDGWWLDGYNVPFLHTPCLLLPTRGLVVFCVGPHTAPDPTVPPFPSPPPLTPHPLTPIDLPTPHHTHPYP